MRTRAVLAVLVWARRSPRIRPELAAEAFVDRSYREEVLDAHLFESLDQVRGITDAWLDTYNTERPHDRRGRPRVAA